MTQADQRSRKQRHRHQRDRGHADARIMTHQPGHHRQSLRQHHLASDGGGQDADRNQQQQSPASQQGFRPRQMQADNHRRDRQRQRDHELQIEEWIVHGGHDIRPNAEHHEEHRDRQRGCGEQRKCQQDADGLRAPRIVGCKGSNELIGIHRHCSRNLAVRLASARCSATRTAPSLIANFAAVSLIDVLSTAIDCNTSRWRAGKD